MTAEREVRIVALVGPRAAGKSTVGRALAAATGWRLVDTDARIAARVGRSAGAFLAAAGGSRFRRVEATVVLEELALAGAAARGGDPLVVALGGGAILSPPVRSRLARSDVFVVFLCAPAAVLVERYGGGPVRPPLTALPRAAEVQRVLAERMPLYRDVSELELDTSFQNVPACVRSILASMGRDDG